MSFDHAFSLGAQIAENVSEAELLKALEPLTEYFGITGFTEKSKWNDRSIMFDKTTRDLIINTSGNVSYGFSDRVEEALANLGPLTTHADCGYLTDHSTGDLNTAIQECWFGPTKESILTAQRDAVLGESLNLMKQYLPKPMFETVSQMLAEVMKTPIVQH